MSTRLLVYSFTCLLVNLFTCLLILLSPRNLFTLSLFTLPCKENSHTTNLNGVNWLSINALLACKRCPLRLLLTPFWSTIKHLLCCNFTTYWFTVDCSHAIYTCFCRYLWTSYLNFCNGFSNPHLRIFEVLEWKGLQCQRMITG